MVCSNCGYEHNEDYCPACGKSKNTTPINIDMYKTIPTPKIEVNKMPVYKSSSVSAIIVVFGVLILLGSLWQLNIVSAAIGFLLIGVSALIERIDSVLYELRMTNYNLLNIKNAIPVINPEADNFINKQ